jgi:hypothetical protein
MNSQTRLLVPKPQPQPLPPPGAFARLDVRIATEEQVSWFDQCLKDHHYLGAGRPVGDYLRQIIQLDGKPAALLVWGPACYSLKDRDLWISWTATQRTERLKLIVQNRRFLLLSSKGDNPNLGSQVMGAALRVLAAQWQQCFGYRPLLAESFTDPEAYAGTSYKASNWEPVGYSAGYRRHRADFYIEHERPKRLWLRPLVPEARQLLRSAQLPEDSVAGIIATPSGALPVKAQEIDSLVELFRHAPDPRDSNTRYRIGPVLTLVALAMLAGRRDIAEIARFATRLTPAQRQRLGLPRKRATRAFYEVPQYGVFYQVLTRMDPEVFATLLNQWLQSRSGTLPKALAMDGKMIRNHIGLLTLAQHDDGAPQAMAIYDQKEGTARCEQTAAAALLEKLPALDDTIVTADPLHCQRAHARCIVEKGGDFLFQVKANQPKLFQQGQKLDALPHTPFLPRPSLAMGAFRTGACTLSPSSPSPPTSPSPEP